MLSKIEDRQNMLVLNNEQMTVYKELKSCLETCNFFYINVAFISYGALQLFLTTLSELRNKDIHGKVITSTYLNFSDPKAFRKLKEFKNIELKVYNDVKAKGFHSKGYIFEYDDYYKVIIGSANLTCSAMKSNIEWNIKVESNKNDHFIIEVKEEFENIWDSLELASDQFINKYEAFFNSLKASHNKITTQFEYQDEITPNSMQTRAMDNLAKLRTYGEKKALVIAATGTGKTYMSAFDIKQCNPKRVLFIVHREDILKKAEQSFKTVLGNNIRTGFLTGNQKEYDVPYLFTTIQTLSNCYSTYNKNEFDYIVLDEAHHLAGETYQRVLNHFEPSFLLGMTATPERCDGFDIFNAFDGNVAIEIRLHEAMEEELVVPFHYFGISDLQEIDYENMDLNRPEDIAKKLKINQRVDYIIEQMNLYGHDGTKRKCLAFCVNIDHAQFMSDEFNKQGIPSVCLTGQDTVDMRSKQTLRLENENDPLQVIFTVDIFNEGIDIPSINLVLMLRPTNSPIVFIQQLGRGLRKNKSKEYLTVIDFIGNHNRAFLIAIALKGCRYYDKDSLKVSIANDFVNIQGETFVQLDEISKERILRQIETENFNSFKYLKQEYLSFKTLLHGKTPKYLMDYLVYEGAPNPIKFINYKSNYIEFLSKVEDDDIYKELSADSEYMKFMKYPNNMLPLKRPYEFAILLDLLKLKTMDFNECKQAILKYLTFVEDDSVWHSMETLGFKYYDSSQMKIWGQFAYLDNGRLKINSNLNQYLNNPMKKSYLEDTFRFGLMHYKNEFEEEYHGIPFFKLYAQYSMQEIALLANYRKTHSSYRGSGLLTLENDYFLFVNLHKDEDIKESIDYKDKFLSRRNFQWQSPNATSQDSERGKNITHNKERGIHLHLFIRKFETIDGATQPYIYVGKMDTYYYDGEKPITIHAKLEHPLTPELYNELTQKVDVEKKKNQ